MSIRLIFIWIILVFEISEVVGQGKFWVTKEAADQSMILSKKQPAICSDWLSICSYSLSESEFNTLNENDIWLAPVQAFEQKNFTDRTIFGFALEQLKAEKFTSEGLSGKGVKIGIIDGGFLGADANESLAHLYSEKQIKFYKDYITPDLKPYGGLAGLDDSHGTEVWQLIGGYNKLKNIQYGLATEADYYLARTDHGGFEKRIEEDYLIKALEDMEAMGIKLINISLGYNLGFNNAKENYKPDQMDGKTSQVARAVDYAALNKGMLIVVAAGNEGNLKWRTLSTPGDAKYALTVGSSKLKVWDKMDFSSIGPDYTDFVKPDIAVYSTQGTSFSTPVVTGMAACLWQMDSTLTNFEIIDIFKKAGNFYPYPNNYLGYGVPTCDEVLKVYRNIPRETPPVITTSKNKIGVPINKGTGYVVLFHKKDTRNVMHRSVIRTPGKKIKVKRPDGAVQTSVLMGTEVIEIFWK